MKCIVFQRDELCTNHKNTPYILTVLYLILIHLWNEGTYKIHLLLQVWNEIIADNEHKLGKLGESKFIHMTVNGGGLSCLRPLFTVNAPNPAWSIQYENGLYSVSNNGFLPVRFGSIQFGMVTVLSIIWCRSLLLCPFYEKPGIWEKKSFGVKQIIRNLISSGIVIHIDNLLVEIWK